MRSIKTVIIFTIVILSVVAKWLFDALFPCEKVIADISKCPACYGTNACSNIDRKNIQITPFNIRTAISHLFASKNVFYGHLNDVKIVIKKLASNEELTTFDAMICRDKNFLSICPDNPTFNFDNNDFIIHIHAAVSPNFHDYNGSGLILCPTTHHLQVLIDQLEKLNFTNLAHLWTLVKINPEPMILQILRAEEGWPVPRFFGACGRIVIEEYIGHPLVTFYHEPWLRRAKIAADLLEAAHMFTFRRPDLAFYLMDVSPDNIAVDDDDKPKFVDLEHMIIVNKIIPSTDQPKSWNYSHVNDVTVECENCFAFSPQDICSHRISDHNYYSVCQNLLSPATRDTSIPNGLLHSVPSDILNQHPELLDALNQCDVPSFGTSRIEAGDKLRYILSEIVNKSAQ